jgi:hypothetical protein
MSRRGEAQAFLGDESEIGDGGAGSGRVEQLHHITIEPMR